MMHTATQTGKVLLQELAAPAGWTALLLPQAFPVDDPDLLLTYRDAANRLFDALVPVTVPSAEDVLLVLDRCRPSHEVLVLRSNARHWMPQFGVGIWPHQPPPRVWTREEVMDSPGRPRPLIERVVLVAEEASAQRSAWLRMLGSGALLRVTATQKGMFLQESTQLLQPTIADDNLSSFPFYVPLLSAATLQAHVSPYDLPLDDLLPGAVAYVRESVEDEGLFFLLRQDPATFWSQMDESRRHTLSTFDVRRMSPDDLR